MSASSHLSIQAILIYDLLAQKVWSVWSIKCSWHAKKISDVQSFFPDVTDNRPEAAELCQSQLVPKQLLDRSYSLASPLQLCW
jgi:hypothetical protein